MKIDFYLIPEATLQARLLFACRVLEKAYGEQHQVYVHADNHAMANQLNDLLWTFKDISFVPHQLNSEKGTAPIQVGFEENALISHNDILLNLNNVIPNYFIRFNRVIEIVSQEKLCQNTSREHYRQYQSQGYEINTYDLRKK